MSHSLRWASSDQHRYVISTTARAKHLPGPTATRMADLSAWNDTIHLSFSKRKRRSFPRNATRRGYRFMISCPGMRTKLEGSTTANGPWNTYGKKQQKTSKRFQIR